MQNTMRLCKIGLKQIVKDGMLLVMIPAPFLIGAFFKFFIPLGNRILTDEFSFSITEWYGLADGMLICLTPVFTAIISAFQILEERDEGISVFYQVTPAGSSYLAARIGMPMVWAFFTAVAAGMIFHISNISFVVILAGSFLSSLTGTALSMMVVSIAGNRVEGLAVSKLMGISFTGLIIIWFVPAPYHYLMAFLPSFWIGKLLMGGAGVLPFLLGIWTCFLWTALFAKRFWNRCNNG